MVDQRLRAGSRATIGDVYRLSAEGERYELVEGRLAEMSPTSPPHAAIEAWIGHVFLGHIVPRDLGMVYVGEMLCRLDTTGRLARAPDVAFVRRERLPPDDGGESAFPGAPDVAVEIKSANDRRRDVDQKIADYLTHGCLAVLLVDPPTRSVELHRPGQPPLQLGPDEQLDLDPALPGFRVRVDALFPPRRG